MKKYFLDQLLFLTIGIVMAIIIPFLWDSKMVTILEIVVILSWTYLCRRILILPIDFIVGKLTKTVYFSALCRVEPYEFYKGKYCCKWKFYYGSNKTLTLLVPVALTREELSTMPKPDNSAKVRITYFRFSKILLDWDQSGDWTSLSA